MSLASWRPRFLGYWVGYHVKWWWRQISWSPNEGHKILLRVNIVLTRQGSERKGNMWNEDLHYSSELLLKEIHQRMFRPPEQSLTGRTSRLSGTLNVLSLAFLSHLILYWRNPVREAGFASCLATSRVPGVYWFSSLHSHIRINQNHCVLSHGFSASPHWNWVWPQNPWHLSHTGLRSSATKQVPETKSAVTVRGGNSELSQPTNIICPNTGFFEFSFPSLILLGHI